MIEHFVCAIATDGPKFSGLRLAQYYYWFMGHEESGQITNKEYESVFWRGVKDDGQNAVTDCDND